MSASMEMTLDVYLSRKSETELRQVLVKLEGGMTRYHHLQFIHIRIWGQFYCL